MTALSEELLRSFDPSTLAVNEACLLPRVVYTSDDFYDFERDAIFGHEWLCVGRADQVPEPGDYIALQIADEPLLLVRDKEGVIRVLSAVCQHRGMVVAEGSGHCTKFTCPYHHWSYGLDGRLLGAPAMERAVGFEKSSYPLPSLKVEIWQGFVFCNFDPDAEPLAPRLSELEPLLENFQLADATTIAGKTLPDLPWNWKVMMENFNDPYHASRLHDPLQTFAPSGMSDFFEWREGMGHISRIQHFVHMDGSFNPTMKCLMPVFPKLTDDERSRGMFILIPPTLALAVVPDEVAYFSIYPDHANSIRIEIGYCFDPAAIKAPLFKELFAAAEAGVDNFNVQDVYANRMTQRGLRSRFARRGRYSWQEETLPQFNRWLVERYRRYWPVNDRVTES
ncbi:MAG: aromatic ring-hydroxylating dioxygenase subunit alpha [Acidobacteriota bacterium]|nr:aromatic ring-hydroxylating dioxygenase subunit alpha [Acidobacteriota bacterium]